MVWWSDYKTAMIIISRILIVQTFCLSKLSQLVSLCSLHLKLFIIQRSSVLFISMIRSNEYGIGGTI